MTLPTEFPTLALQSRYRNARHKVPVSPVRRGKGGKVRGRGRRGIVRSYYYHNFRLNALHNSPPLVNPASMFAHVRERDYSAVELETIALHCIWTGTTSLFLIDPERILTGSKSRSALIVRNPEIMFFFPIFSSCTRRVIDSSCGTELEINTISFTNNLYKYL